MTDVVVVEQQAVQVEKQCTTETMTYVVVEQQALQFEKANTSTSALKQLKSSRTLGSMLEAGFNTISTGAQD